MQAQEIRRNSMSTSSFSRPEGQTGAWSVAHIRPADRLAPGGFTSGGPAKPGSGEQPSATARRQPRLPVYASARSEGREGLDGKKATWVQLRFLG